MATTRCRQRSSLTRWVRCALAAALAAGMSAAASAPAAAESGQVPTEVILEAPPGARQGPDSWWWGSGRLDFEVTALPTEGEWLSITVQAGDWAIYQVKLEVGPDGPVVGGFGSDGSFSRELVDTTVTVEFANLLQSNLLREDSLSLPLIVDWESSPSSGIALIAATVTEFDVSERSEPPFMTLVANPADRFVIGGEAEVQFDLVGHSEPGRLCDRLAVDILDGDAGVSAPECDPLNEDRARVYVQVRSAEPVWINAVARSGGDETAAVAFTVEPVSGSERSAPLLLIGAVGSVSVGLLMASWFVSRSRA